MTPAVVELGLRSLHKVKCILHWQTKAGAGGSHRFHGSLDGVLLRELFDALVELAVLVFVVASLVVVLAANFEHHAPPLVLDGTSQILGFLVASNPVGVALDDPAEILTFLELFVGNLERVDAVQNLSNDSYVWVGSVWQWLEPSPQNAAAAQRDKLLLDYLFPQILRHILDQQQLLKRRGPSLVALVVRGNRLLHADCSLLGNHLRLFFSEVEG